MASRIHRGVGLIGKLKLDYSHQGVAMEKALQGSQPARQVKSNWPKKVNNGALGPKWRVPWAQLICHKQQLNCLGDT